MSVDWIRAFAAASAAALSAVSTFFPEIPVGVTVFLGIGGTFALSLVGDFVRGWWDRRPATTE